jgi:group I intron endonuclease
MQMIIYLVTNLINGKMYIGQTTQLLRRRWNQHCRVDKRGCSILYRAIKKYGKENFIIEVITICSSIEEMNYREVFYIKLFNTMSSNGYNQTSGGEHPKWSDASRKIMADSAKIAQNRPEVKQKNSESNKIAQNRPEVKNKIAKTKTDKSEKEKAELSKKLSISGKIAQNKPETKKQKSEFNVVYQNLPEVKQKKSETMQVVLNKPNVKKKMIDAQNKPEVVYKKRLGMHRYYHVGRNIFNLNCEFCRELINKRNL